MKVKDLNNKECNWPPSNPVNNTKDKSELHIKCRELLKKLYPTRPPLEEVSIPNSQLKFDFVLPQRRICIEVQGKQHFEHVGFFFKSKLDFGKAQQRDKTKQQWCNDNGLLLIELNYDEDILDWQEKILLAKH